MFYCEHNFVCLFICLLLSCWFFFFCWSLLWRKRVLPPVSVLKWLPLPPIPFFNLIVHINQGADQLDTKLSTRLKALESALDEKTLKVFMNFMSQAKVENVMQFCLNPYEYAMFCWIYFLLGYIKLKCFSDEMSSLMPSLWVAANPYAGLWNFPGKVSY